jgi:hypothetical protein
VPFVCGELQKGGENAMVHSANVFHRSFTGLSIALVVFLSVVLFPIVTLSMRALIVVAAICTVVLLLASCFSKRIRNWIYS